jgi:hypothetical protein
MSLVLLFKSMDNNIRTLPIERIDLKVRYGEGFGGAPLRAVPAMHRVATGVRESRDEQAPEQSSSHVGGNDPVWRVFT